MNRALETTPAESQVAERDGDAVVPEPKYLGTPAICRRLGIERHTWHRWVVSGQAPSPAPLPGNPRWRLSDILRFERGRRVR